MRVEKVTNNSRSLYVPKGEIRPTPKRGGLKLRAAKSSWSTGLWSIFIPIYTLSRGYVDFMMIDLINNKLSTGS